METCDLLIENARVWTHPGRAPAFPGWLAVRGERIAAVGGAEPPPAAARRLDALGALLMPGLVQTHLHACQTLFRGRAEDLPLLPWLRRFIWPLEAAHDPESLRASADLTAAELIRGGTTCVLTMETTRHTHVVLEAFDACGLSGFVGHCLMDETGGYAPIAVPLADALREADALRAAWGGHPRLRPALAPRFALSCSTENLRAAADYARAHGLLLHTHSSEQEEEVELVRTRTGLRNVAYLDRVGLSGRDVLLAHVIHTDATERGLLRETGTRVLHCPSANLKLASGICPVPEYLAAGISVSLGGDGAPCNNRLDAFLEMREAGLLQKLRRGAEALPASEIAWMATTGGAEALGLGAEIGTLEPGKRADCLLVRQDDFGCLPSDDPATTLVYSNLSSDVRLTLVAGRILYQDGHWLTLDAPRVRAQAREQIQRVLARAGVS
jgi:5-methylthioadenosine/S-adenosylhomocysteine deaminase